MCLKYTSFLLNTYCLFSFPGQVIFNVNIMESTGTFEISESDTLVCSGFISMLTSSIDTNDNDRTEEFPLTSSDVYKELRLRGYDYGPDFRGIVRTNIEGKYMYFRVTVKSKTYE